MDPRRVRELLEQVHQGKLNVDDAFAYLQGLPFKDLGFATVDHHRALRQGVPEVVFGEGKTGEQIAHIAQEMIRAQTNVLITRLDAAKAAVVTQMVPEMRYSPIGRTGFVEMSSPVKRPCAPVAVVTAGTSDMSVAEEAAETLSALGLEPRRMYDIGVAGIHRLLHRIDELRSASAAIVCAGMEGALPSVVGGMISTPVVAVPTNVGYGTAMNGFTALFAMLTSCAAGVAVVNIENGFGAAMVVHRMMPQAVHAATSPSSSAK